ncbi:MAG: GTPase Era [Proteobacteria bacterium]|nr:GTPase Era [Pseudomonadota bacterium]
MTTSKKRAQIFKTANVAIFGRPNAGKSTLLNALLDVDFSAVSNRPNTTRKNIRGVLQSYNEAKEWDGQFSILDTPGINLQRGLLERSMHMSVEEALDQSQIGIWIADAKVFSKDLTDISMQRGGGDKIPFWIDNQVRNNPQGLKWIILLNKADSVARNELLPLIEKTIETFPEIKDVIPVSASAGKNYKESNIDSLIKVIKEYAVEGEPTYTEETWTDLSERALVENLIRETIFQTTQKEVPYCTDATVVSFVTPPNEKLRKEVGAVIWVSKKNLKPMLVGAQGQKIKEIGITVRKRIKEITGEDMILKLFVKVVERWEQKTTSMQELGYEIQA